MSSMKDKARELLDNRLAVLDDLEVAQQNLDLARARLAETQTQVMTAWDNAIIAGWTPTELKRLGVTEPTKRRPGRPRSTGRQRRPQMRSTTSTTNPEPDVSQDQRPDETRE